MEESKRIRLFNTEDFGVDIEYNSEMIAVHLPWIKNFNIKVYKDMVEALEKYSDLFRTIGQAKVYTALDQNNIKQKKLLKKLGFIRVGISGDLDIYERNN